MEWAEREIVKEVAGGVASRLVVLYLRRKSRCLGRRTLPRVGGGHAAKTR